MFFLVLLAQCVACTPDSGDSGPESASGGPEVGNEAPKEPDELDAPPDLACAISSQATLKRPYSATFRAFNVESPWFSIASGALPRGLTLSPDGVLHGTPTAPGTFEFAVNVTDHESGRAATRTCHLTVSGTRWLAYSPIDEQLEGGLSLVDLTNAGLKTHPIPDVEQLNVQGFAWAPSGQALVFWTTSEPEEPDESDESDDRAELYVVDVSGEVPFAPSHLMTSTSFDDVVWAPGSTRLAYSSVVGSTTMAFSYDLETREAWPLGHGRASTWLSDDDLLIDGEEDWLWSHFVEDGRPITPRPLSVGPEHSLTLVNGMRAVFSLSGYVEGGKQHTCVGATVVTEMSEEGATAKLFDQPALLDVAPTVTRAARREETLTMVSELIPDPAHFEKGTVFETEECHPGAWSANGGWYAVARGKIGAPALVRFDDEVDLVRLENAPSGAFEGLQFAPSSRWLAMSAGDTTYLTQLKNPTKGVLGSSTLEGRLSSRAPAFSPNSRFLVYATGELEDQTLVVVDLEKGLTRIQPLQQPGHGAAWIRPHVFSLDSDALAYEADGVLYYVELSEERPEAREVTRAPIASFAFQP